MIKTKELAMETLAKQQSEFEQAMLLENTAIADFREDQRYEYNCEQREIDAEYEQERNDKPF